MTPKSQMLPWTDPRHPWMRDYVVLELPPLPPHPRRCEHCSGGMSHRRAGAIYCSDRCARRARCADRIGRTRLTACIECGATLAHRSLAAALHVDRSRAARFLRGDLMWTDYQLAKLTGGRAA